MKDSIKNATAALGLIVRRDGILRSNRRTSGKYHHETILPDPGGSSYAPWRGCSDFIDNYRKIRTSTLVDEYRCFELWDLVGQVSHLPGNAIQVGVWRGGSGCLIAARLGKDRKTYLYDTFRGVVKATDKDTFYRGGEHADADEGGVDALAKTMGLQNVVIRKGVFPDDFQQELDGERFCFAHIDVDVYLSAKETMDFVWPRMPVGAIVVFDDYGAESCDGIRHAVDEYRGNADKVIVHNLNGHAVVTKTA